MSASQINTIVLNGIMHQLERKLTKIEQTFIMKQIKPLYQKENITNDDIRIAVEYCVEILNEKNKIKPKDDGQLIDTHEMLKIA